MSQDFLVYIVVGAMVFASIAAFLLTRFPLKRRTKAIRVPRLPGGLAAPSPRPGLAMGVGGAATPHGHKHQAALQAPGDVGEVARR